MKRDSFNSLPLLPAATETVALAQELLVSGNVRKTARDQKDVFQPFIQLEFC